MKSLTQEQVNAAIFSAAMSNLMNFGPFNYFTIDYVIATHNPEYLKYYNEGGTQVGQIKVTYTGDDPIKVERQNF